MNVRPAAARVPLVLVLLSTAALAGAAVAPARARPNDERLAEEQFVLLREAHQVIGEFGDELWPGWSTASKTTLLVAPEHEFLLGLPKNRQAPAGFAPTDQDFMGARVYTRPRQLPRTLRTALALDGNPTAVVGAWRSAVESPNEWVVTLVEQWFRVLLLERGEQLKISDLALAPVDVPAYQIEYPFPFDDPDVGNALLLLGQALYDFWEVGARLPRAAQRSFLAETAWAALQNFRTVLELKHGPAAYRYFQLKSWREGVTRYSGIIVAREIAGAELAKRYRQTRGFENLPARQSYSQLWEETVRTRFWLIRNSGRDGERDLTTFNALGHGLAELLDGLNPEWKARYFDRGVWLDDLVAETIARPKPLPRRAAAGT